MLVYIDIGWGRWVYLKIGDTDMIGFLWFAMNDMLIFAFYHYTVDGRHPALSTIHSWMAVYLVRIPTLGGSQPSPLLFSLLVFSGSFHLTH